MVSMTMKKNSPMKLMVSRRSWIQTAFLLVWLDPLALRLHGVCGPVFHCYSCPLAAVACPIGILANFSGLHLAFLIAAGTVVVVGALVGSAVCGWACPFGALQELLYSLPILRRIKHRKVPFLVSNVVRSGLFLLFLLFLFGMVGPGKGFVVYHFMNPFNLFNFDFEALAVLITIVVALALALAIYRPFCQFICPFGFISWLAERLSLMRVRVNPNLSSSKFGKSL